MLTVAVAVSRSELARFLQAFDQGTGCTVPALCPSRSSVVASPVASSRMGRYFVSSACSHARAIAHSRLIVAGDRPVTSAVSSTLSPAK